jgi:peptidase A4-like protein
MISSAIRVSIRSRSAASRARDSGVPTPASTHGSSSAIVRLDSPRAVQLPSASVGHTPTAGFSGYELRSGRYHRAVGHFTQPIVSGPGTSSRVMSTWVGLNSAGNGRLVQAGAADGIGSPWGSPFWELFCSPNPGDCNAAQVFGQYPSHPGDVISVNVSYDNSNMSYYQVAINGVLRLNTSKQMRSDSYGNLVMYPSNVTTDGFVNNFCHTG